MDLKLIKQIKTHLETRPLEELLKLWEQNDREQYSDEAFEAFKQLIDTRGIKLPPQKRSAENEKTEDSGRNDQEKLVPKQRIPCNDGNCVGTVNEKGICNTCGKPYAEAAISVLDIIDGLKRRETKYCPKCKTTYDEGKNFCGRCGMPLLAANGNSFSLKEPRKEKGMNNGKHDFQIQNRERMRMRLGQCEPFNLPSVGDHEAAMFMRHLTGNETFEFDGDKRPKSLLLYSLIYKYPRLCSAHGHLLSVDIDTFESMCSSRDQASVILATRVADIEINLGGTLMTPQIIVDHVPG